ncbi:MAG: thiol reductant ABC exporter subunit CydD [Syntrophotaleaceae bacterium]
MATLSAIDLIASLSPRSRRWVFLSTLFGGIAGFCIILQAWLVASVIHQAVIRGIQREAMLPFFAALLCVIILRSVLVWGRELCSQRASTLMRQTVRQHLLQQLNQLGPTAVRKKQVAPLVCTLLERVEALHGYVAHYQPQIKLALLVPLMIVLVVFSISWMVGLTFALTAPLIPLFMVMIGRGADKLSQKNFQQLSRMSAHFLDTLQGLPTLKLFGRSAGEADRIGSTSENYRKGTMAVLRVAFLSSAALEFFTSMAIALTAVFLGMTFLQHLDFGFYGRGLTLQTGLFVLLLAPEFYQPLRELGVHYHARAEALGAAEEIRHILAQAKPLDEKGRQADLRPGSIDLELQQVSFTYEQGRPALNNLCLSVKPGEWIAVVGASGSGKSTLLQLLLQFLPLQEGQILINGKELSDWSPSGWRELVAWVPQRPTLFFGSIRENISMGNPHLDEHQIENAAKAARVIDFSADFPLGLDTPVGEQGKLLSGGQARRLALARAFAKKAPLLLLDEPTAGLDVRNERLVMESLRELAEGRTVIMLTHRLDTARAADRIVVMAEGAIVEDGDHGSLLARDGIYAGLVHSGIGVLP